MKLCALIKFLSHVRSSQKKRNRPRLKTILTFLIPDLMQSKRKTSLHNNSDWSQKMTKSDEVGSTTYVYYLLLGIYPRGNALPKRRNVANEKSLTKSARP